MPASTSRIRLTAGRVASFTCPPGKSQAFRWDTESPALALRATPSGRKTYVFEARLKSGETIRMTIGTAADWALEKARMRASELKSLVDQGKDPREVERQQQAALVAERAATAALTVTVKEAWDAYLEDRRPFWGERHYQDHLAKAQAGGLPASRGTRGRKVTIAGPLHSLMSLQLRELTAERIAKWAADESKGRPTVARLAWRLLRAFLTWCGEHDAYKGVLADGNPAKTRKARETLGRPAAKKDALQREQLKAWFTAVRTIKNSAVSAYLQTLLLTGARPGEVLEMRWKDVGFQWRTLTLRDKDEGERTIPLTPYVAGLLAALPNHNEWVFASTRVLDMSEKNIARRARNAMRRGGKPPEEYTTELSASGHIAEPSKAHDRACKAAGIDDLTLHGLRRSFGTLAEWVEVPTGIVAQLMGHKPSATAEKHYRVRPLDLLRLWHERIECWVLVEAGVVEPSEKGDTISVLKEVT